MYLRMWSIGGVLIIGKIYWVARLMKLGSSQMPLHNINFWFCHWTIHSQRAQDAIITSLWRQNDVATCFDVIMTLYLRRLSIGNVVQFSACTSSSRVIIWDPNNTVAKPLPKRIMMITNTVTSVIYIVCCYNLLLQQVSLFKSIDNQHMWITICSWVYS